MIYERAALHDIFALSIVQVFHRYCYHDNIMQDMSNSTKNLSSIQTANQV